MNKSFRTLATSIDGTGFTLLNISEPSKEKRLDEQRNDKDLTHDSSCTSSPETKTFSNFTLVYSSLSRSLLSARILGFISKTIFFKGEKRLRYVFLDTLELGNILNDR